MNDPNYLWFDYAFNWTKYVSGPMGDAYYYCAISAYQTVHVAKERVNEYPSSTDWVMAFIQNMLGNVIAF